MRGRAGLALGWAGLVLLGACSGTGGTAEGEDRRAEDEQRTGEVLDVPAEADSGRGLDGIFETECTPDLAEPELRGEERGQEIEPYPPLLEGAGAGMEVQTDSPALPFPFDWFTVPAPETATGLKMALDEEAAKSVLLASVLKMIPSYAEDAGSMDGFGSIGLIILPINTPMSQDIIDSAAGKDVLLYEVPEQGTAVEVSFSLAWQEAEYSGKPVRLLEVTPHHALAERTAHLLLLRRSLVDAAGEPFAPPPMAEVLLGLREPFGPKALADRMALLRDRTLAVLARIPDAPAPEEVAAAVLFTVGTMTADLQLVAASVEAAEVDVELDPDGDGKDNVFGPGQFPPWAGNPPEEVGLVVEGRFLSPDYRGPDGLVGPVPQNQVWHDFFLVMPAKPEGQPFPLVLIQHGINSHKETELGLARRAAGKGMAAASFDFLYHAKGESNGGFSFVQIDGARKTVGNFRQSALDMLAFARALQGLAAAKDLYPLSGADGIPDLSDARIAFSGHSLGALESSIAGALSSRQRVAGLIAGGGSFRHLFETFLKNQGLYDLVPPDAMTGFRLLASHMMSPADPAAYAHLLEHEPAPGHTACSFLLLTVLEDGTIPAPCAEAFTRASHAPLVEPFDVQWPDVPTAPAAGLTSGTLQLHGDHEFIHESNPTGEAARAAYFHFLSTFFESGKPEILWPVP